MTFHCLFLGIICIIICTDHILTPYTMEIAATIVKYGNRGHIKSSVSNVAKAVHLKVCKIWINVKEEIKGYWGYLHIGEGNS